MLNTMTRTRRGIVALCLTCLAIPALMLAASAPPQPMPRQLIAVLNGGQETPPVDSQAFGVAYMTYDHVSSMLSYSISYNDLSSAETAAHFHGPAVPGMSAGALFGLGADSPKNGTVGPLSPQERNWLSRGMIYINVHSEMHGPGEIRGQVIPMR
jgi:hypothetical protein